MSTTRITVTLDQDALVAARAAAGSSGVSLSAWLSRTAHQAAVAQAAAASADQDRQHPEWAEWDDAAADRMFDAA